MSESSVDLGDGSTGDSFPLLGVAQTGLPPDGVRLGTWNVSWWTNSRFGPLSSLGAQLVALQETKLLSLQLENARGSVQRLGYTLHHGLAAAEHRAGGYGDRCGVGILASPGVAVSPLMPQGGPWRRLHAMSRVHAVFVPPRAGLAGGLRIFSVYAPLPRDPCREAFTSAFLEMVSSLDMQVPTILLGDFNGSICPDRDYSSHEGPVCRLLSRLLGPGGPFVDLQVAVSPELYAYTFQSSRDKGLFYSRCDLALGNRAALGLVARVFVESGIMDGGHSPLLLDLHDRSSWSLNWKRPRPCLPDLLRSSARVLRTSEKWETTRDQWIASPEMIQLRYHDPHATAANLSTQLEVVLQALVRLAGGWATRVPFRRHAYKSEAVRHNRCSLKLLGTCAALLRREIGLGSLSYPLTKALEKLGNRGIDVTGSRHDIEAKVAEHIVDLRRALRFSLCEMRQERFAVEKYDSFTLGQKAWFALSLVGRRLPSMGLGANFANFWSPMHNGRGG